VQLRLFSWNVNGLRAVLRKGELQNFLAQYHPDVLCLQEIKCRPDQLDLFETNALKDYQIFWNPAKRPGYSGTAILLRKAPIQSSEAAKENPRIFRDGHEGEQNVAGAARTALRAARLDVEKNQTGFSQAKKTCLELSATEGRILILEFSQFHLLNIYTPNSKPDLSRLSLRHDSWDPEFKNLLKDLEKTKPVITCGDFNAAHQEIDLARPASNHHSAGFTNEEREGITNLLQAGFLDSFRTLHPTTQRYTWWSHWGQARANNVGWRIDYFFLSQSLQKNLKSAEIYESQLGSDHCPISITLEFPHA